MEEFSSADDAVVKAYKDIIANGHDKGSFLELNNYSFILFMLFPNMWRSSPRSTSVEHSPSHPFS